MRLDKLIEKEFVDKILVKGEYHDEDDFGDFNPYGKKILQARLGFNDGREDAGILLKLEGCDEDFFFYDNEDIIVE